MHGMITKEYAPADLETAVRNRYFYGKLLDVFHFELETDYMNYKRWLLNRLVTGWGVVCGLDVLASEDGAAIYVTRGMALDPWGREIIVPTDSRRVDLPDGEWEGQASRWGKQQGQFTPHATGHDSPNQQGGKEQYPPKQYPEDEDEDEEDEEDRYYHVVICYNECRSNPTPVLAGDCGDQVQCETGTVEERYKIEIRPGRLDPISVWECMIPDAITRGELQYEVLVRWVTDNCPELPGDPCVPLANIRIRWGDDGPYCETDDIDINVRQLALSNRALFYLLMSMLIEAMPGRRRR